MIGNRRLCTIFAAGLLAAAPAAAQASPSNPFLLPRAERFEHARPGRHQAWRLERRGRRLEWKGERLERRGERLEHRARWLRRHGRPAGGRALARRGERWEHRGDRLERRGERFDRRADRLRHRHRAHRRERWQDGRV
jgi:hypothetical protein